MDNKRKTLLKDLKTIAKSNNYQQAKIVNHEGQDFISLNSESYLKVYKQGDYELVVDKKGVIKTERYQSMSVALQSSLLTQITN